MRNDIMEITFELLSPTAIMPSKANDHAAGIDFFSDEDVVIPAGGSATINTNVAWMPSSPFCYLQMQGRSGLTFKHGLELCNAGVIDSDYRGPIKVLLHNTSGKEYRVLKGDKIAQGVVLSLPMISIMEGKVDSTERGSNGFGSTGR